MSLDAQGPGVTFTSARHPGKSCTRRNWYVGKVISERQTRRVFAALCGLPDCPAAARVEHAAFEAGRRAGNRKPAVHLVNAETFEMIAPLPRRRSLQTADRGRAAANQTVNVASFGRRGRLPAADGDGDVSNAPIGASMSPRRSAVSGRS